MQKTTRTTSTAVTLLLIAACCLSNSEARHQPQRLLLQDSLKPVVTDLLGCGQTFSILKAAVSKAGLLEALTAPDADITLFAPTNQAFQVALDKLGLTKDELLESDDLADILKYHVIPGKILSKDIPEGLTKQRTLLGPEITIINEADSIKINDANVEYADLEAQNGVVHVIDQVLLPPDEPESESEPKPEPVGRQVFG